MATAAIAEEAQTEAISALGQFFFFFLSVSWSVAAMIFKFVNVSWGLS